MDPLRAYFEDLSEQWDENQPKDRDMILSRLLAPHKSLIASASSLLELGSGTGALSPILTECYTNANHISLDLAYGMLLKAKPHKNGNHLIESDVHKLPFIENSFDIAVCHNCFPHFQNKTFAMREIQRVLMPGSWLLILHDLGREKINTIHQNASNPVIRDNMLPPLKDMIQYFEKCDCTQIQVEDTPDHYTAIGKMP